MLFRKQNSGVGIKKHFVKILSGVLVCVYVFSLTLPSVVFATQGQNDVLQTPSVKHDPKRGTNPETGKVSFIGNGDPIYVPGVSDVKGTSSSDRALGIAKVYGNEFGLKNPAQELKLIRNEKDENGKEITRFQQMYRGLPVIAAELIINANANGELLSISGEVSSDLSLDTKPAINAQDAQRLALNEIARLYQIDEKELVSTDPQLAIFDESLLTTSTRPVELVWHLEVTATDVKQPIREMVLVNAQTGTISFHVNQVETAGNFNTSNSSPAQQVVLPLYFDLVVDESRGWIYGSDTTGNKVDVIDTATSQLVKSFTLVNGAAPRGMDFDPTTDELAVAQNGSGSVIFIDPDTGTTNTAIVGGKPFDVIYGRSGRLYSVGSGGTTDYIHVIDTLTHMEVARSSYAIYSNPRLAISSDKNFLYTNMTYSDVIYKFDVSSDTVQTPASSSRYGLYADHFILAPDDSEFITDKGQVWSSDLKGQISSVGDWVGQPAYIPARDAIAIAVDDNGSNDRLVFSSATNFYPLSTYVLPVQGTVGPIVVDAGASKVFVSTNHGLVTVDISVFPPGVPVTLPSGSLPYADLVIDEVHNVLYGSNTSGNKIDVISLSTLQVVDEIRFNNNTRPKGMDLKSDSQELAVALHGGSSIAFIDTNTLTITATVIVETTSYNVPFDVKYGRAGRLYSTGNPSSSGTGDVYIYDTNNYTSIGKTSDGGVRTTPYLGISSDNNTLFTIDTAQPNRLCKFNVSTDTIPAKTCASMGTYNSDFSYILLRDGSKIFTGNGQVWLPSPLAQLGSFTFSGYPVEIVNSSVIAGVSKSSPGTITFVRTSDFYTAVTYTMPAPGTVGPSTANADGSKLFVNTQTGIKVINVALTNPVSLSLQGGSPQSAHILTAFDTSLQAKVQNLQGDPLAGIQVTFTAPATGASGTFVNTNSNITTAITDSNGIATASALVANNLGGTYSVSATVANLASPLNFQLTNIAPSVSISSGSLQSSEILTTFVDPLKVIVQFAPGEPIAGMEVTFTAPVSGASGTFVDTNTNIATAITDANGIVAAPAFTANSITGSYLVKATIPGITTSADFQLTNLAGVGCTVVNGSESASLFLPYRQYNCGKEGYAVGVADFNGDNKKDVALSVRTNSTGNPSSLLVFIQGENGNLSQPRVYAGGNRAEHMAVGDLNNDGLADIVTADFADNKISVFIQRNTGGFAARVAYDASSGPDAVAIHDVNNDGLKDVVIAHHTSAMIGIFTQKSDGTLNTMTTYPSVAAGFDDIAIGDVNNDGLNDVVKMNGQGLNPNLMVYLQNVSGTLNTAVNYSIAGCTSDCLGGGIAIGDVTGDGRSDVLLSYGGNRPRSNIAVFAQNENGSLQASVSYPVYDIPGALEIADIDMDGLKDVVVVHEGWSRTGVLLQRTNGTLAIETLYTVPNLYTDDLDVGDINNDSLPDVAIADNLGLVLLYRNATIPSTVTPGPGPSPTPRATSTAGPTPTAVPTSSTGNRSTFTASGGGVLPGTFLCDQSQPSCTNGVDLDADAAHQYTADTFVFYNVHHHRNSFDDLGSIIYSTVNYGVGYQNAFWNGYQMVYGDNMAADDVVGHEITHGVTQYTSNLIYSYQSGAINESFSDVWGEFIDQTNGSGNDTAAVKWLMGEDSASGAGRSMSNPPSYSDPDKMSSPYYYTGSGDNGGVHINSGVNNKAAYLMVEGGTFNNRVINGIGLDKTAAVYYEVQVHLLTMGANYNDLYYALVQGCQNLIGGTDGITEYDCEQVRLAAEAVEMVPEPLATATPTASVTPTFTFTPTNTDTSTPSSTWTPTATPTPAIFTLTLQPDAAAGADSYIYTGAKTTNYGSAVDLSIGEDNNTNSRIARSLIRFDLSSIPTDATITSATLSLWTSSDLSSNTRTIHVYRLKVPFNESQVTWSRSAIGVSWQVAGASGANDRESIDIGSLSILDNEALNTEKQIILSPAHIQELVNGTFVNRGFIIVADTELNDRFNYLSSDSPTASQRPKLLIQYTLASATPTETATITPSPTLSPTSTEVSATPSFTPSPTWTPITPTATRTSTITRTPTRTMTVTLTRTPTRTITPSRTPTNTPFQTTVPTHTPTAIPTETLIPTATTPISTPVGLFLYVKWDATGANNGTSWANAYTDLQSALAVATSGQKILVAAGTYKPTSGIDRTVSFVLKNDVEVYGGFAGTEASAWERDFQAYVTILSGDIGIEGDNSDNSYHVVVGSNTNNTAVLDGFTITGGNANVSPSDKGGGMYNYYGSPSLANLIFTDNYARFGGGMNNESLTLSDSSNPSLLNVSFINNSAVEGGGMRNMSYSSPTLENVKFQHNTVIRAGGGMVNMYQNNVTMRNVEFSGNMAGTGGGLANAGSNPILENVTFSNNSAEWGGAISNGHSSPTIINATFYGNSATTYGGAISNESDSDPILINVTISGNSAVTFGGGMYSDSDGATLVNSILYGNNGGEIAGSAVVNYSVIQGGYTGTGNIDADPLLGLLQANDSFTQTMALLAGSPAIDAGDDTNCPVTDQRGVTRPQGNGCDIGAFEYVFPPTPTPTHTAIDTPTFIPTDTPTFTFTPSPTASVTPTFTSTPTDIATSTPTFTLTPTNTATLTATATEPFTPTSTLAPTNTFTPSPSPTISGGFPTTVVRDTFNRSNGSIGNNWYGYPSAFSIASNQLDVTGTGSNTFILWKSSAFGADQEAYVTLTQIDTAAGNEHKLILKSQNSKNLTTGLISVVYDGAGQTVQVWTYHPTQGWVQHGTSIPVTFVNGDQFGARARPDGTVEVYRNGILLGTFNITSWPFYNSGGYVGLWFVNAPGALLDDFGGGTR